MSRISSPVGRFSGDHLWPPLSVHRGCLGRIPAIGGLTTLATERILSLKLTTSIFDIEPDLDPAPYESEAFGVTSDDAMTVVVRVRADQAPYVSEREWHPTQKIQQLRDGGIQLTFCAGGNFEIERWILGWGDAVEVIAPESLRESVKLKCEAMGSLYRRASDRLHGALEPKLTTAVCTDHRTTRPDSLER